MIKWVFGVFAGLILALIIKEIGDYLPSIGRWLVRRSVRNLFEPMQTELRERWLAISDKFPGGLTKVLWGVVCSRLARFLGKPFDAARASRLTHRILFYVYLRITLHDFVRLRFASPRQLIVRWKILKMFVDHVAAVSNPSAPQPLAELIEKPQKQEGSERHVRALQESLRVIKERGVSEAGTRDQQRGVRLS